MLPDKIAAAASAADQSHITLREPRHAPLKVTADAFVAVCPSNFGVYPSLTSEAGRAGASG